MRSPSVYLWPASGRPGGLVQPDSSGKSFGVLVRYQVGSVYWPRADAASAYRVATDRIRWDIGVVVVAVDAEVGPQNTQPVPEIDDPAAQDRVCVLVLRGYRAHLGGADT